MNRRKFIKTAALSAAMVDLAGPAALNAAEGGTPRTNPIPRWRGFNLVDFNSPNPSSSRRGTGR